MASSFDLSCSGFVLRSGLIYGIINLINLDVWFYIVAFSECDDSINTEGYVTFLLTLC